LEEDRLKPWEVRAEDPFVDLLVVLEVLPAA